MSPIATHAHTERSLAADLIVDLLHAKYLPLRSDALARVRDLFGLTADEVRDAVERHNLRHKQVRDLSALPYTYAGTVRFDDVPDSFAAPAPETSRDVDRPPLRPPAGSRRPARRDPSPLEIRFGAARHGFILPDGEYVGYLAATADQHAARAEWLTSAAAIVSAAADHHQACAETIRAAGVRCLAELPEQQRPAVPALQ